MRTHAAALVSVCRETLACRKRFAVLLDMANEVAKTIVQQLGNLALSMMGAYQLVALDDGLQFAIRGSRAVSKIVIKLDAGTDTYTVSFHTGRGLALKLVSESDGVYVDALHRVIESATGLATRL